MSARRKLPPGHGDARPFLFITDSGARIDLVEHARFLAQENLPHQAATAPSELEEAIRAESERQHQELAQSTRSALHGELETIRRLEDQIPRPQDLDRQLGDAEADVQRLHLSDTSLMPLRQRHEVARRALRHFKRTHGLTREASYPASKRGALAGAALVALGEAILNLGFFVPGASFGYVGAFLLSLGVAATDAAGGLLAGWVGVRFLHHARHLVRWLAGGTLALLCFLLFLFNLAVAAWRDVATEGAGAPLSLAHLIHSPLDLSLPSAALLGLGMIATCLYVWKGAHLDDLVPGYGEVDRKFRAAEAAFQSAIERVRLAMVGRVAAVPTSCDTLVKDGANDVHELEQSLLRVASIARDYESGRADLEERCRVLLLRFREENGLVRSAPAPEYFQTFPILEPAVEFPDPADLLARLEAARRALSDLYPRVERIRGLLPERLSAVSDLCHALVDEAVRRADLGRADGSEHYPHTQARRAS